MAKRRKSMGSRKSKSRSKMSKPIAVTKVPKNNKRGLKSGVALVYGTRTRPKIGSKRFKTVTAAKKYVVKKGLI